MQRNSRKIAGVYTRNVTSGVDRGRLVGLLSLRNEERDRWTTFTFFLKAVD